MSLLGDGADLKGAIDKCASPLHQQEFFSLQPHPNTYGRRTWPTDIPSNFQRRVGNSAFSV